MKNGKSGYLYLYLYREKSQYQNDIEVSDTESNLEYLKMLKRRWEEKDPGNVGIIMKNKSYILDPDSTE